MSERRALARSSITVTALNAVNLVVLLLLQIAIAAWFGAARAADAFFLASAVPSAVATALVGSLNVSLIPHYVEFREREGAAVAWRVVCTFVALLSVVVGALVVAGVVWAPQIVRVVAPAYDVAQRALTVELLRLSLPSVWFLCVAGVIASVHFADGSFAAPGWAVALNNVLILSMTAALYRTMGIAVCALGLTVGAALQLLLVAAPLVRRRGLHFLPTFSDPRVWQISAMALPLIAASAVYKSDVLVGRIIAALLPAGDVSYLSYAHRIALMIVAVSGAGLTTVVFPRLAKRAAVTDHEGLGADSVSTMKYAGLVTAMVLVPVCALASPLVTLALQRGAFTSADSAATAAAVVAYAGFAYAGALAGVASNCLYSMKKVGRVVAVGLTGFAVYVGLAALLVSPLGFLGVAVAGSIAALINLALYLWMLRSVGIPLGGPDLIRFHARLGAACTCAWAVGIAAERGLGGGLPGLAAGLVLASATVVGVAAALGAAEARALLGYVRDRVLSR